jgi:hypothetical protein
MFLAMVGASSAIIAGCSSSNQPAAETNRPTERHQPTTATEQYQSTPTLMNPNRVYQIAQRYYVGPKRERPPANDAENTIWEVTDPDGTGITRRTLSDGDHWVTLMDESQHTPGEYYLTPKDGFTEIQRIIDRTGGDVVIRLAPGTYVGSELTLDHGVLLEGSGRNATTLKLEDGANTDLITTPDIPSRVAMACTLRDITFDGNKANNTAGNVVYGAFWNGRFIDCEFVSAPESGFWLAGSKGSTDDNQFRGCRFANNADTGLRGGTNKESFPAVGVTRVETNWFGNNGGPAITAKGNSWKIMNSKLYDNAVDGGATIELNRGSYSHIINCDIYSGLRDQALVAVSTASGGDAIGNKIKNNDFRGSYRSAVGCFADGNAIIALQVSGNTMQSEDGRAVSGIVARENGGSFINCSFRDNTFVGEMTGRKVSLSGEWAETGNLNAS